MPLLKCSSSFRNQQHGDRDDPLDQPRFLCALDEPLAQRLAADVRIQLNNYLMYDK